MDYYQFGNVTLVIDAPITFERWDRMELFRTMQCNTEQRIVLNCRMEEYEVPSDAVYLRNEVYSDFYQTKEDEICMYAPYINHEKKSLMWLVVPSGEDFYQPKQGTEIYLNFYIHPEIPKEYLHMHELIKHIHLVHALQKFDVWILHSCYVSTLAGGILFTGNSGVGKSTQGDLWMRYADATIVNGDRSLIYEGEDGFYANGFIYSGSSPFCLNESSKIRAIVFLKQGAENRIISMRAGLAIRNLYMQLVSSPHRHAEKDKRLNFAEKLYQGTEVLMLECRPDEEAVRVLQEYLMCH